MNVNTLAQFGNLSLQDALVKKAEALGGTASKQEALERQKVAQEFASFLFLEVLKAMRAALPQDGFLENEKLSRDIYTAMMDAEIARVMAQRDATGFTRTVEQSLEKSAPHPEKGGERKIPAEGVISSVFGLRADPFTGAHKFHNGVDIAAPAGTPVKAVAGGKVVFSGAAGAYGNLVELDHGNGVVTRYGHNSANLVAVGDEIQAGQPIALVGSTGRATGSHVHFEVRKGGRAVSPAAYLGEIFKGSMLSSVA